MADSTMLLEAKNVSRTIDRMLLINHASLSVSSGDRVAITGPSGCGKSLFLRTIAMLEPMDSGAVLWKGRPVDAAQVPEHRSRVIYVMQQPAKFEMTVEQFLRIPFTLSSHRHRSYDLTLVANLLSEVGKDASFLKQPHDELSGGESQLVSLIRAIQLAPTVLLLDEPTTGLDPDTANKVETLIESWQTTDPNRASLWVSHDADQIQRMCDRSVSFWNVD